MSSQLRAASARLQAIFDHVAWRLRPAPEPEPGDAPLRARVDAYERRLLEDALARHGYHQRRTAEALGLSYDQLRGLLRRHGLRSRRRRRDTAANA